MQSSTTPVILTKYLLEIVLISKDVPGYVRKNNPRIGNVTKISLGIGYQKIFQEQGLLSTNYIPGIGFSKSNI